MHETEREAGLSPTHFVAGPHTWDVRAATGLRAAWGGSGERPPLLDPFGRPMPDHALGVGDDAAAATERVYLMLAAGDIVDAWHAYGMEVATEEDRDDQEPPIGHATFTDATGLQVAHLHSAPDSKRAWRRRWVPRRPGRC